MAETLRHARLIHRARKDPRWVLRDRRCAKPDFCRELFDVCDDLALQEPRKALAHAAAAVELARKIGDPHLIHRAYGVHVHARLARRQRAEAEQLLDDYRLSALSCCEECSSDWMMRRADLAVESADGSTARGLVERSREALGDRLDADTAGRLSFIEGIGRVLGHDRDGALEKVGEALRDLDLSSPRGYFLDSLAFVAWYLIRGAEERHFVAAREILDAFRERLAGVRGWADVRVRKSWVEGLVLGRLGEWKPALKKLERGREALRKSGPPRHAVAVTVDVCQAHARWMNDVSQRKIQRMLEACRGQQGLEPKLRKQLGILKTTVSWQPKTAPQQLAAFRGSFIVPVPGLLDEMAIPIPSGKRSVMEGEG
jgi:hypothetical protein